MKIADRFNDSGFSRWINGKQGRIFRFAAGIMFLILGIIFQNYPLGIVALVWSFFPISAGAADICYISACLGGPLSGYKIRKQQKEFK